MIRTATRADLPRIHEIRMAVTENVLSNPEKIVDSVDYLIDHEGFWVFEIDGVIAGFSSADPRDGSIFALFVDKAFEGRGAGQALLARACKALRDAGHRRAWLNTGIGTRAERFYRENGWTEIDRTDTNEITFNRAF